MSNIREEIHNVLADGYWYSSKEILDTVCQKAGATRVQVNSALHTMSGSGEIIKEREETGYRHCRFRIGKEKFAFGISASISMFDSLLKSVRTA